MKINNQVPLITVFFLITVLGFASPLNAASCRSIESWTIKAGNRTFSLEINVCQSGCTLFAGTLRDISNNETSRVYGERDIRTGGIEFYRISPQLDCGFQHYTGSYTGSSNPHVSGAFVHCNTRGSWTGSMVSRNTHIP